MKVVLKWMIWTHCAVLLIGIIVGVSFVRADMPDTILIKRTGEENHFAVTKEESAKILNVQGGDDPGTYLGFPIYKEKDSLESQIEKSLS